jgi:hypothetical protein
MQRRNAYCEVLFQIPYQITSVSNIKQNLFQNYGQPLEVTIQQSSSNGGEKGATMEEAKERKTSFVLMFSITITRYCWTRRP